MFPILIITIILLAFAFAGIGIKMFLKKDGSFTKSCQRINPATGEKIGCTCKDNSEKECANQLK